MKTLTLWTIILVLFTSCSTESEPASLSESPNKVADTYLQRITGLYPENIANAYDSAGQLYYDVSESYLTQGNISVTTATTISQVEAIANSSEEFQALRPATYTSPTASRIDYILNDQQVTALNIISNSSLSEKAKISLRGFLTSLMTYRDLQVEYDVIYDFVIDYETAILADSDFTANDQKVILATASISRYGFYFAEKRKRKPRDRDWEISWGHIVAAIDGSEESTAKAIVMSAVCGIISNK